jgi:DNA-directed RNA polymerase alpha subunit
MITYEEFLNAVEVINNYKKQVEEDYIRLKNVSQNKYITYDYPNKNTLIKDSDLSVRALTVLHQNNLIDKKIKDLSNYSITDLLKFKNMGKRTLNEIKMLCHLCGFSLKL